MATPSNALNACHCDHVRAQNSSASLSELASYSFSVTIRPYQDVYVYNYPAKQSSKDVNFVVLISLQYRSAHHTIFITQSSQLCQKQCMMTQQNSNHAYYHARPKPRSASHNLVLLHTTDQSDSSRTVHHGQLCHALHKMFYPFINLPELRSLIMESRCLGNDPVARGLGK